MSLSPDRLEDSFGRIMRDLRISVTDRCNFRCLYCLPETEEAANFYRSRYDPLKNPNPLQPIPREWKPKSHLLTFEEIERVARIATRLGIQKLRITGGEPLLRRGLPELIEKLARLPGVEDLAMTTNGFLFANQARQLRQAGLRRVSFSLDSLEPANFRKMTGREGLDEVLRAIAAAKAEGFSPIKINAVVIRGMNDHEVQALAEFAGQQGLQMRFIEFMPLDSSRAWLKDMVVPAREILERLRQSLDLEPVAPTHAAETARRWKISGTQGGEIGLIAPVSEPFCGHCNRLRLTADGKIRTCLFSIGEHDLRPWLRSPSPADDDSLGEELARITGLKEDRHHIGEPEFVQPERTMSCIGG